jgi:hypothetical protein
VETFIHFWEQEELTPVTAVSNISVGSAVLDGDRLLCVECMRGALCGMTEQEVRSEMRAFLKEKGPTVSATASNAVLVSTIPNAMAACLTKTLNVMVVCVTTISNAMVACLSTISNAMAACLMTATNAMTACLMSLTSQTTMLIDLLLASRDWT